jgi:transposase
MEELIKLLDKDLQYDSHDVCSNEIQIHLSSKRKKSECPYCSQESHQIHSRARRTLKDLPIQSMKVKIILSNNKYFCKNPECARKTFAERFAFFEPKATKTKRLQEEIMRVSLTQSSISASRYLKASIADVGKSTICNLLKKGRSKQC